jgi:hypothetical protein
VVVLVFVKSFLAVVGFRCFWALVGDLPFESGRMSGIVTRHDTYTYGKGRDGAAGIIGWKDYVAFCRVEVGGRAWRMCGVAV